MLPLVQRAERALNCVILWQRAPPVVGELLVQGSLRSLGLEDLESSMRRPANNAIVQPLDSSGSGELRSPFRRSCAAPIAQALPAPYRPPFKGGGPCFLETAGWKPYVGATAKFQVVAPFSALPDQRARRWYVCVCVVCAPF